MATKAELKRLMDESDVETLEAAVRVIRRRQLVFGETSRAGICWVLLAAAARIRAERADA